MNAEQLALIPRHVLFDRHGETLPGYLTERGLTLSLAELDAERRRRQTTTRRRERTARRHEL